MPIAVWDDNLKTGHTTVDSQHKQLFAMVNELHEAIVAKKQKEVLSPVLEKLAKYTVDHFRTEEDFMSGISYPELAAHRQKHQKLTKEVQEIIEKYRTGQAVLPITLSNFLANWLRHHIKEDDVALVKYMNANRESPASAGR